MSRPLPVLPFHEDALEPYFSRMSIRAHFEGFHRRKSEQLREMVDESPYESRPTAELMRAPAPRAIRDAATQVWNHAFLWRSLTPPRDAALPPEIDRLLVRRFGGLHAFQHEFEQRGHKIVGSGWIWLVLDPNGAATILLLGNAANPMAFGYEPLLGCDLWEHAYFLDFRHDRSAYLEAWWNVVDWRFVNDRLRQCRENGFPARA